MTNMLIDAGIVTVLITGYIVLAASLRHLWKTITQDDLNDI